MSSCPGAILVADTAFMSNLADETDGIQYLIVIVDMYSKYLCVIQVTSLKSTCVIKAFEAVVNKLVWYSSRLESDKGSKFINKAFKSYLASKNMTLYTECNKIMKSVPTERVI